MHYNKLKIGAAFLCASIVFSSCKKDYLETNPTDQVSTETIFTTTTGAWAAINGIHRQLYNQHNGNQDEGGQSKNMIDMEMLGEDLVNPTTANGWFIATHRWLSHRSETGSTPRAEYDLYYLLITNANVIIANIDKADGPDADKKAIKGQALAYRAWSYFQLVQLFGQRFDKGGANNTPGVPLVLVPTKERLPRASVAEVYAQILKDIDEAISNLDEADSRANPSHINVNVAKGIKARIALTTQDWATAAAMAKEAREGFDLMSEAQYLQGFNDYSNPEWMWSMHQVQDQTTYFFSFFAYMSANFNSSNIRTGPKCISSKLYNALSSTDIRKQLWDPTGENTSFPIPPGGTRFPYMNRKFLSAGGNSSSIGDIPLMRTAEMYLIEAEANARLNKNTDAAQALFELVSKRDPQYVLSTQTGTALITEILTHRRAELWGEGFRFYDLKRLNQALNRNDANHDPVVAGVMDVPAGDKMWQFLIPREELDANPNVVQNPL